MVKNIRLTPLFLLSAFRKCITSLVACSLKSGIATFHPSQRVPLFTKQATNSSVNGLSARGSWAAILIAVVLLCRGSVDIQASVSLNEKLTLLHDLGTDSFNLSWWGEDQHTYFIQFNPDLTASWEYVPLIEQGFDDEIAWGFYLAGGPDRAFFRLRFTDLPAPDPYLAVFGGDGIPSGWKLENGLDPFIDYTGLSPDGSTLTYWEHWQLSLDGGNDPAEENVAGLIVYTP